MSWDAEAKPQLGMLSSSERAIIPCIIFRLQCWLISYHAKPPLQHHAGRGELKGIVLKALFRYPHSANKDPRTFLLPSPFFNYTSHSLRLPPLTFASPLSPSFEYLPVPLQSMLWALLCISFCKRVPALC